ncbi:hypothetical protein [Klebsiella aerogenes]|uniref:hypothetical protein n=1 Tax=Klebsiella aerogenes TaxID=548 RepID=UPI002072D3EB|nr:hypothetical protein [Klebsiella aerogenes]
MTTDITELAQLKPGKYAILYRDNWDGEKKEYHTLAVLTEEGSWYDDEFNAELLKYQGDKILKVWPLDDGSNILALVEALEKAQQHVSELISENAALKGSVENASGCIDAAYFEGLADVLAESNDERLVDLVKRRLLHAYLPVETPATNDVLVAMGDAVLLEQLEDGGKAIISQSNIIGLQANRIAELESRTVKLPPELYTIAEIIRTQDNRITDQPMFVVFQKREIIGSDEHSPSRICWVWDGEEVSELRAKRLEALYQDGRDTRGYDRYAMQEVDEFVTACFTEHGCKDYLRQNGHNLRQPYIYACGSFRNNEYQLVRNWLAGIKWEAE